MKRPIRDQRLRALMIAKKKKDLAYQALLEERNRRKNQSLKERAGEAGEAISHYDDLEI